jgi:hypothetical protein
LDRLLLSHTRLIVEVAAIVVHAALFVRDSLLLFLGRLLWLLVVPAPASTALVALRLRDSRDRSRRHECCGDYVNDMKPSHLVLPAWAV